MAFEKSRKGYPIAAAWMAGVTAVPNPFGAHLDTTTFHRRRWQLLRPVPGR